MTTHGALLAATQQLARYAYVNVRVQIRKPAVLSYLPADYYNRTVTSVYADRVPSCWRMKGPVQGLTNASSVLAAMIRSNLGVD